MENRLDNCHACPFLKIKRGEEYGHCELLDEIAYPNQCCNMVGIYEFMNPEMSLKVLRQYQKWRRGGKEKMASPYLIGMAIDEAIRTLRKDIKNNSL